MRPRAECPEYLAKVLESMNKDLVVELRQPRPYIGDAAHAYVDFTSKVSRVLAAAGIEADPLRRISEFSTAELLEELRRRHSRD
ncbi:hypothetical protein [Mycobacterium sp. D16R24]|uniref:hypothetical protein n=1 Tax=Mycobacterium sp. D16R24 TaxID=1855656 RepID=UPI0009943010|nr:hypothetical protein [Mycobacterium sp. D16R24]